MQVMRVIDVALELLLWGMIVRAILSWFPVRSPRGTLYSARRVLEDLTDPILAPIRKVIPIVGGLDFSVFVAVLLIQVVRQWLRVLPL